MKLGFSDVYQRVFLRNLHESSTFHMATGIVPGIVSWTEPAQIVERDVLMYTHPEHDRCALGDLKEILVSNP